MSPKSWLSQEDLDAVKPKNFTKGGKFDQGCKKKSSSAQFFLQPSVAFKLDFNQNMALYRMQVILGR